MILERVTPESVGIHSEGILKFIDLAESRGLELHSMMLLRHGQGVRRGLGGSQYKPGVAAHDCSPLQRRLTSTGHGFCVPGGSACLLTIA